MNDVKCPMIKIQYSGSVPAKNLGTYFTCLNKEFQDYIRENNYQDLFADQLSIKEIRQGSLEIFPILDYAASVLPIIDQVNVIVDFFKNLSATFSLLEKNPEKVSLPQKQLAHYKGMNGISVAGNNIVVHYSVVNNYGTKDEQTEILSSIDNFKAKKVEENINAKLLEYKKVENMKCVSTVFYWDTARFNKSLPFNYKGICKKISPVPYNVIFENDALKSYMTRESHLDKPWQDLCYVVDIELIEGKSKPVYKITNVYEDQTFYQEPDFGDEI